MTKYVQNAFLVICALALPAVHADDRQAVVAKEKQVPQVNTATTNKNAPSAPKATNTPASPTLVNFKPFTGKILGNGVRLRLHADVESSIVKEMGKDDLVIVNGEKGDFYALEAPSDIKAYIFRSFVLDNVVEGNRVNIRLEPELSAPVIGYMNSGDKVQGTISQRNHKWLEITPPKTVHFFVAKEFIEKLGGPEIKSQRDKKKESLVHLMDAAELLGQSEMMKPFQEIDFEKVSENYNTVISEYSDFHAHVEKAKSKLMALQELYLQKKLTYLESKASRMSREMQSLGDAVITLSSDESALPYKDRIKIWERAEESQFLAWAMSHHQKNINDFYDEQREHLVQISGIVEPYSDTVKNKPGNFLIRERDMPKAYVYSTMIDLQNYVGRYVTLQVTPRPNNNFAFPAYFVFEVEK